MPSLLTKLPRPELLRQQAANLDAQAAQLEGRGVNDSGMIGGGSADDLLAQAVNLDNMIVGPSLPDAEAWAREAEAAQRARVERFQVPSEHRAAYERLSLTLSWRDGDIDHHQSRCARCRRSMPNWPSRAWSTAGAASGPFRLPACYWSSTYGDRDGSAARAVFSVAALGATPS